MFTLKFYTCKLACNYTNSLSRSMSHMLPFSTKTNPFLRLPEHRHQCHCWAYYAYFCTHREHISQFFFTQSAFDTEAFEPSGKTTAWQHSSLIPHIQHVSSPCLLYAFSFLPTDHFQTFSFFLVWLQFF